MSLGASVTSELVVDDVRLPASAMLPEDDPELEELFWQGFWDCLACSYPQRTR